MSFEELEDIDALKLPVGHYISTIFRVQTLYLTRKLERFNINPTQLHFLFEIKYNHEINQDRIASNCSMNKGAVARSIKKLEDNELIVRKIDNNNRRQNKISLTEKGEKTLEESIEILDELERKVLKEIDDVTLKGMLHKLLIKTMEINNEDI